MVSAWHRQTDGTVLANRISADFQDRGATTLIGQEIADHKDLADLAEIYRNPQLLSTGKGAKDGAITPSLFDWVTTFQHLVSCSLGQASSAISRQNQLLPTF